MSLLVAIEGADGAGKNTAACNVASELAAEGVSATVISFPRYDQTVGGSALGEFLSGRMRVPVTPSSLAVLYALDRFESLDVIRDATARHDVVLFDRYIASNVAYQGAKVPAHERPSLMNWIVELETLTFTIPVPDLNVYLDTPLEIASGLMLRKASRSYTDLSFDQHEADLQLQRGVRYVYEAMVPLGLVGPWSMIKTVRDERLSSPRSIALDITKLILHRLSGGISNGRIAASA